MMVLAPLFLGLLSWGIGVAGIVQSNPRSRHLCSGLSLLACCSSLYCCLYTINHWAKMEDISAILDCAGAYLFCSSVLLTVTFVLNFSIFVMKAPKQ